MARGRVDAFSIICPKPHFSTAWEDLKTSDVNGIRTLASAIPVLLVRHTHRTPDPITCSPRFFGNVIYHRCDCHSLFTETSQCKLFQQPCKAIPVRCCDLRSDEIWKWRLLFFSLIILANWDTTYFKDEFIEEKEISRKPGWDFTTHRKFVRVDVEFFLFVCFFFSLPHLPKFFLGGVVLDRACSG